MRERADLHRAVVGADPGTPQDRRDSVVPVAGPPVDDTAAAVAYWRAIDPNVRVSDLAVKVGRSQRQVRRILADLARADAASPGRPVNGTAADHLADSITAP